MNAALAFFLSFVLSLLPQVSITGNVKIAGPVTINAGASSDTIAYVNGGTGNAGSGSCPITYSPTASNQIYVGAAVNNASSTVTVADNATGGSSTYTQEVLDGTSVSGFTMALFFAPSVKSGATTITVSFSGGGSNACALTEYSGQAAGLIDHVSSINTVTGTSFSAGTVTTTIAHSLIESVFLNSTDEETAAATGVYNIRQGAGSTGGPSGFTVLLYDTIPTTTGTYGATGTVVTSATISGYSTAGH